jgi:hypothetical protein
MLSRFQTASKNKMYEQKGLTMVIEDGMADPKMLEEILMKLGVLKTRSFTFPMAIKRFVFIDKSQLWILCNPYARVRN